MSGILVLGFFGAGLLIALISAIWKSFPKAISYGYFGALMGGVLGFLLRPAAPLVGQLGFETVITQGENLRGADALLISSAQTSFNYLIAGTIVGAIAGVVAGVYLFKSSTRDTAKVDTTKKCPFCAEMIQAEAKICRFCGKSLESSSLN